MENYINTLPIKQVVLFLVIGGLLHVVLYIITTYALPIIKTKKESVSLYWQRIQIISWTIFLLLFFSSLFKANIYLTLAITGIVLGIGWTFWTNFFAGNMIKFTNQFKVNDAIDTDIASGSIKAIKMTYTEVISPKGELMVIPNNQLKKAILKHQNKKNILKTHTFACNASSSISYNIVRESALNCPFFTANHSITVEKDNDTYQIKAMLLDESFKDKVCKYFENLAKKNK